MRHPKRWVCVQGGLAFNPTNVTALSLSSTFFNYAPCLIQEAAAGAAFTAAGINFVPQVPAHSTIPKRQDGTAYATSTAALVQFVND